MNRGQLEQRLLVLITLGLVAFGLVMVYSATSASAALGNGDPVTFLKRQGIYALAGVALMLFFSRFDHRRLRLLAPPLVLAALGLCIAVLVIAPEINGAEALAHRGAVHVPAVGAGQGRAADLGGRVPRRKRSAADARLSSGSRSGC